MDLFPNFHENYDDPYLINNPISTPFLHNSNNYDLPQLFSSEDEFNYNSENNINVISAHFGHLEFIVIY